MNLPIEERAITIAIHPRLATELRVRKETIENETGRKTKGGLTCFSEMAAMELRSIRASGDQILNDILKLKHIPVKKFIDQGVEKEFVPYEIFKKVFILSSVLSRKKDSQPLKVEMTKLRGLKKNEIKYFW